MGLGVQKAQPVVHGCEPPAGGSCWVCCPGPQGHRAWSLTCWLRPGPQTLGLDLGAVAPHLPRPWDGVQGTQRAPPGRNRATWQPE